MQNFFKLSQIKLFKILDDGISGGKSKTHDMKLSNSMICMKPPQPSKDRQQVESLSAFQNSIETKIGSNFREDLKAKYGVEAFLQGRKMDAQIKK